LDTDDTAPPDPGVNSGERLRAARERAGLTIEQVAARLRLAPALLAALENGRREELPPAAYVRGYLRSYAQLLGLDPQDFAKARLGEAPPPIPRFSAAGARKFPSSAVTYGVFLVVIVAGLFFWHTHNKASRAMTQTHPAVVAQRTGVLPLRLQSLSVGGGSNGQVSTFPLGGEAHDRYSARINAKPPVPLDTHPRNEARIARAAALKRRELARSKALLAQRSAAPPTRLALARRPFAYKPSVSAAHTVTVAPAPAAVPSPGGLISLPVGHRYVGLRISTQAPVKVVVRDANGMRLLDTEIAAGESAHVMGRAPFHVALSRSQGVIVKVGGRPVVLPAAQKGQSLRVTVEP